MECAVQTSEGDVVVWDEGIGVVCSVCGGECTLQGWVWLTFCVGVWDPGVWVGNIQEKSCAEENVLF